MKKLIGLLLAGCIFAIVIPPLQEAKAQIYTNRCCDAGGFVRCVINPSPLGTSCFCYGQGWGVTC